MLKNNFNFSIPEGELFFFTSFVATLDGKVIVKEKGYWPLGSKADYDHFTSLRAHADVIIDGKNTAQMFGKHTIDTIHNDDFIKFRQSLGKTNPIEYVVVTTKPDETLLRKLSNSYNFKTTILTTTDGVSAEQVKLEKLSTTADHHIDLDGVVSYLKSNNHRTIFIDGGAQLLASFLQKNLINELFLTIAPKIVGNQDAKAMTMVEGILFPPDQIKHFTLISAEPRGDEVYLQYRFNRMLGS